MAVRRKFRGLLQPDGTSLGWTVVRVPFEPIEVWPRRKGLRVRGSIAGVDFRTSLFRTRAGVCVLPVNKSMQKKAGIRQGSLADVVLEPDIESRPCTPAPPELEKLLRQDRALRKWHDALSPSRRSFIATAVAEPKSPAVRTARAELWAERMMLAMEGELGPPPILQSLFNRQPIARQGWHAMTPIQRRNSLLGIFSCQSPESRRQRAEKAVAAALLNLAKKEARQRRDR